MRYGLGNAGGILVGNLLGRNAFDQAKVMGDRLCVLVAAVGVGHSLRQLSSFSRLATTGR